MNTILGTWCGQKGKKYVVFSYHIQYHRFITCGDKLLSNDYRSKGTVLVLLYISSSQLTTPLYNWGHWGSGSFPRVGNLVNGQNFKPKPRP